MAKVQLRALLALLAAPVGGIFLTSAPRQPDSLDSGLLQHLRPVRLRSASRRGRAPGHARPIMFVHVHKSAGTSMCRWAMAMGERLPFPHVFCASVQFGDAVTPADTPRSPLKLRQGRVCARRTRAFQRVTWNHIEHELCEHDRCFGRFSYATLLRETVDRIVSQVEFEGPPDVRGVMACLEQKRQAACPPDALRSGRVRSWVFLDNFLVRSFGGCGAVNAGPGMVTRQHLKTAIATLERFDLVIPLQNMTSPRAQREMDRVFGWHVARKSPHYNWPSIDFHTNLTKEDVARLRRINSLDIELTNHFFKGWGIHPHKV